MGWRVMYAVMDSRIVDEKGKHDATAKAVLMSLARHADDSGSNTYPSRETIAAEAGLGKGCNAVASALRMLKRCGYIVETGTAPRHGYDYGPGRPPTKYAICMERLWPNNSVTTESPPPDEVEYAAPDADYQYAARDARNGYHAPHAQNAMNNVRQRHNNVREMTNNVRQGHEYSAPRAQESLESDESTDESDSREEHDADRRRFGAPPSAHAQQPADTVSAKAVAQRAALRCITAAVAGDAGNEDDAAPASDPQATALPPSWLIPPRAVPITWAVPPPPDLDDDALQALYVAREEKRIALLTPEERDAEEDATASARAAFEADTKRTCDLRARTKGKAVADAYYAAQNRRWTDAFRTATYAAVGMVYSQREQPTKVSKHA